MARKPKPQGSAKKAVKKSKRKVARKADIPRQLLSQFAEMALDGLQMRVPGDGPLGPVEARLMMETLMRGLTGQMSDTPDNEAHSRAMDLCDQARSESPSKARSLVQQALQAWPDCADAYVILAELADSISEALPFFEEGVAAGRRALADDWDSLEQEEAFWGYVPSRPFMRALAGLADALWAVGRREDSATRYIELLTLNPGDNQGIRDITVPRLIEMDRIDDAKRILKNYADLDDCFTSYNTALLAFRDHGNTAKANRPLKKAMKANEHVPSYLAGNEALPPHSPAGYSWHSPEEAQTYVLLSQRAWKATPGAIPWLRSQWLPTQSDPSDDMEIIVELGRSASEAAAGNLSDLPVAVGEPWIVACQQIDAWVNDEKGELGRPWAILVLGPTCVLTSEVTAEVPTGDHWRAALRGAMLTPMDGEPRRPESVVVRNEDHRMLLEPMLDGIPCMVRQANWAVVDAVFADLSESLDERTPLTPYVQQDGMSVERVGHFFESAATYYRRAPWTFTATDAAWEVQPAGWDRPWFAIVIGQNGETYGLSLIEHFDDCRRMMTGDVIDDEIFAISAMALNFEEAQTMTGPDLDAAEQCGWSVAAPEAYPLVYCTGRSEKLATPMARDFDLLEATLQTLPDFILAKKDTGTATALVNGRSIDVRLAHVPASRFRDVRNKRRGRRR